MLRSHLGMRGSWRVQPASTAVRGSPWLVLRGTRAQAVLRGGSRLELSARRSLSLGPDILALPLDAERIVANLRVDQPAASSARRSSTSASSRASATSGGARRSGMRD